MGSGKSTVGRILAVELDIPHLDLDDEIEKACGMSVSDIFRNKGEIFFRRKEHERLRELLSGDGNFVLSVGGGTPCYYQNDQLLKHPGIRTVFLKRSVDTLVSNIITERQTRPLLREIADGDLPDFIAKHLFDRNPYYLQADKIISADGKTPSQIVEEIAQWLA